MKTTSPLLVSSLVFVLAFSACDQRPVDKAPVPAPVEAAGFQSAQTESPPVGPAQHRIGVRNVNGQGEFYDKETNDRFVVRGANYAFVPLGSGYTNLLLKVGLYDPVRTRDDFRKISDLGYNTVRVFLDHCAQGPNCIGDQDNQGLNPEYLDNIADMLAAGKETGIYILFTSNDLPDQGGYSEEANTGSGAGFAGYRNSYYLRPHAVTATRRYWGDLLTGLVDRNAAFEAVLGWQLLNEQWMFIDQPPLSLTSGTVETTTGAYDMGDAEQKGKMVSDGLVYYIAQMKEEILLHDPTALVTMGFFAPEIVAPGWYVETASLLERSDLDFFDFHAYPGGPSLEEQAAQFGMPGYDEKPIILGEYGAFRHIYPDLESAARVLNTWAAESCQYGFDGWLYWSYYPANSQAGDRTWGLVEEGDYLLDLFAPINQVDACMPLKLSNGNLAYDKPVTASNSLADEPASFAVDDNAGTQWGSGGDAVQWIEIDLQGSYRVSSLRLLVAQYPAGSTVHRVQIKTTASDTFETVFEFQGNTRDSDWLEFEPIVPLEGVTAIRIQTISSPSWVSWKEIQVFGN
ncbi:MAG: discoidin domain-containing protein [Anaerolineales bacterium]|nr:discoidin domain-containing protein [Anaerolineales bacterium]